MKIEIEWTSSTDAKMTIDGREMQIAIRAHECGRESTLNGLPRRVAENTFGGLMAAKLMGLIGDFMQAECSVEEMLWANGINVESGPKQTWGKLTNDQIETLDDEVW